MSTSANWENPIKVGTGQIQRDIDPALLRPARKDLVRSRLEYQRQLIRASQARYTPIQVNQHAVIIDGHHYVRAAAEEGRLVDVVVSPIPEVASADSILDLPLR